MIKRTRSVDVIAGLTAYEMTEDEIERLKETAKRILRICNLVPQDFDRKMVIELAKGIISTLEEFGYKSQ